MPLKGFYLTPGSKSLFGITCSACPQPPQGSTKMVGKPHEHLQGGLWLVYAPPNEKCIFFPHTVLGDCNNWLARATRLHALKLAKSFEGSSIGVKSTPRVKYTSRGSTQRAKWVCFSKMMSGVGRARARGKLLSIQSNTFLQ